jgi:hypothetical protein
MTKADVGGRCLDEDREASLMLLVIRERLHGLRAPQGIEERLCLGAWMQPQRTEYTMHQKLVRTAEMSQSSAPCRMKTEDGWLYPLNRAHPRRQRELGGNLSLRNDACHLRLCLVSLFIFQIFVTEIGVGDTNQPNAVRFSLTLKQKKKQEINAAAEKRETTGFSLLPTRKQTDP